MPTSYPLTVPSASHTIAPVDSSHPGTTTRQAALIALGVTIFVAGLIVLAGLASVLGTKVWVLSVVMAVAVGWFVKPAQRNALVLTLIPATLLTNSAVVPHSGRYVPAITVIGALLIASRADLPSLVSRIRAVPPALLWLLVAYVAWMGVTTLTSTQKGTSLTYIFGSLVTLGIAFLVIPSLANRSD